MSRSKPRLRGLRSDNVVQRLDQTSPIRQPFVKNGSRLDFTPSRPVGPGKVAIRIGYPPRGIVDIRCCFNLLDGSVLYVELPRVGRNRYAGVVSIPGALKSLTLEVSGSGDPTGLMEISLKPLNGISWARLFLGQLSKVGLREVDRLFGQRPGFFRKRRLQRDYRVWMKRFDERPEIDQDLHRSRALRVGEGPLISLILFAATDLDQLDSTVRSLATQFYERWELFVLVSGHDVSSSLTLTGAGVPDDRIVIKHANKNRAESLNEALALAQGEFVGVLPPGATLPAHAMTEIALAIASNPHAELIYTDEDKLDPHGRRFDPRFKPDWSPDFLRSHDYVGDLALYRSDTLRRVGGWRSVDGAADLDVKLRITQALSTTVGAVLHLPQVLLHVAERSDAVIRTAPNVPRWQEQGGEGYPSAEPVQHQEAKSLPLVSIIIPTRDQAVLLRTCVQSILQRTAYPSYEIIIVDNGSQEDETKRVFEEVSRDGRVQVLEYPYPFNYSAINNHAVRHARGALLTLLNNDVEVVAPGWLAEMVGHAVRPEIGCVGAKLLYPDGTVQHGGIVLGVAGLAGHAHRYALASDPGHLQRLQSVLNVSAVTAACLVVRRSVFDEVGGLDEICLGTAFNDVDLCLKVQAAGYSNLWSSKAVLIHHESKSRGYERTQAKRARLAREEDIMRRRWGLTLLQDPFYSPHLTRLSEDFRVRRL